MANLLKLRIVFYSLILSFGVVEMVLAAAAAFMPSFSDLRALFHMITIGFALFTWIWTSILLSYRYRPLQSNIFTKRTLHLHTFTLFTIIWLALGIMILSQSPIECDFETYSDGLSGIWCAFTVITGVAALSISVFSGVAAVLAKRTQPGPLGNIAGPIDVADEEKVSHS